MATIRLHKETMAQTGDIGSIEGKTIRENFRHEDEGIPAPPYQRIQDDEEP